MYRFQAVALSVAISIFFSQSIWAAEKLFKPESTCVRSYIYRNRSFSVDSSRKMDGEGLRQVLTKNPDAEALLNDYQGRLRASYIPAYTATLGAAMAIAGPLYAGTIKSLEGQSDTRALIMWPGIALLVGSYLYGQYALWRKEKTLENAVETYNHAVSDTDRIRVELTPTARGTGGEVKTLVPSQF